jgi:hypothetical protein
MHQFRLANDRNPPVDQVRYHPLSNPECPHASLTGGTRFVTFYQSFAKPLAELSSVFGTNCRHVSFYVRWPWFR